jgi:hypothetical protein
MKIVLIALFIIILIAGCVQDSKKASSYGDGGGGSVSSSSNSSVARECPDGTAYSKCSAEKPGYCKSGNIINKCSQCGCPSDKTCSPETNICFIDYKAERRILIFVDDSLYGSLTSELETFVEDLKSDTAKEVNVFHGSWTVAGSIKDIILNNDDNLYGIFLIGNLPYVNFGSSIDLTTPKHISDFYYSDLNNICTYNSQYDFYDVITCIYGGLTYGPWVARMKPDSSVDQIKALKMYFGRNHAYRNGQLKFDPTLLYYNTYSKDFTDFDLIENTVNAILTANVYSKEKITTISATNDSDNNNLDSEYLKGIMIPNEWVIGEFHGWYGGHQFNITTEDLLNVKPNSLFYELKSCSVGRFSEDNYAGAAYVFSEGNGLLALASTLDHFESSYGLVEAERIYALSHGVNFADAFATFFSSGNTWIGDPTIRLRQNVGDSGAIIYVNQTSFNLGAIPSGTRDLKVHFTVKNIGTQKLTFSDLSDISLTRKPGDYFQFATNFYNTDLLPGNTYDAQIIMDASAQKGHYESVVGYIISNDNNSPMIPIKFSFDIE